MEKPRWSILCLGIIFFTLNGVNGYANITSCWVTVGADHESLTLNATYDGDDHESVWVRIFDPLWAITAIEAPCETSSSSPDLTFTSCTTSINTERLQMNLYYDLSPLTNTNITLRKFNFPIESQSYSSGSIRMRARNNSISWGSIKYCSDFSSSPVLSLLGNLYINIYIL